MSYPMDGQAWWRSYSSKNAEREQMVSRKRLQRLFENLPAEVSDYLARQERYVLQWGCKFGAGVELLEQRFPASVVAGLEFSEAAVAEAKQRFPNNEFLYSLDGTIPQSWDAVFCIDALQHCAEPMRQLEHILRSCRDLCVVVVPLHEHPLDEFNLSQFREESFPQFFGQFSAINIVKVDANLEHGLSRDLVVIYASSSYRRKYGKSEVVESETDKWNDYYAGLGEAKETEALRVFHREFTAAIDELLEPGAAILEAGCGAAFQSLALARSGKHKVSLMDISAQALECAQRLFERSGLWAESSLGNAFAPGEPRHDLVFNAGVLEHYTLQQQADFIRGMASRSRRYVLVLVPNRLCYWYWIWRIQASKLGYWPWGKECPMADMAAAFEMAGVRFLGRAFLGEAWTEDLIRHVHGLDADLQKHLLTIHRSPLLEREQKCYLMAALGTVSAAPAALPALWSIPETRENFRNAELTAALADSLAAHLCAQTRLRDEQQRLQSLTEQHAQLQCTLSEARAENTRYRDFTSSRIWKMAELLQKIRLTLVPRGSVRAQVARKAVRAAQGAVAAIAKLKPPSAPPPELSAIAARARQSRRLMIMPPTLRWSETLFQRPHHLARQFARLGCLVVYDCTGTPEPLSGFREVEPNLFLYKGDQRHLRDLPDPVLWTFTYNFNHRDQYPGKPACVYDWIDDLTVFPFDQHFLRKSHERALAEATWVASVARKLHEQALAVRTDAIFLPNAAEYERFASPDVVSSADPALERFRKHPKPVAGYYGALASWFDYKLLQTVAEQRPDWYFVLIGPTLDDSINKQPLLQCPNVLWLGPRDYETLPGYLKLFDVAMIPFVINAITLATSPLKLYEYFSGGKPVITTPLPECQAYPEVHIVRDANDFSAALDRALAESRSEASRRRLQALGAENTWEARARLMLEHLCPQADSVPRAA